MQRVVVIAALLAIVPALGCTKAEPIGAPAAPNYNPAAERDDYYPEPEPEAPPAGDAEPAGPTEPPSPRFFGSLGRSARQFEGLGEKLKQASQKTEAQVERQPDDGQSPAQSVDEAAAESADASDAAEPETPD